MAEKKNDSGIYDLLLDGGRIGAERVGEALSGLLDGAARTRGTLERNLESLLGYANIPSRSEYEQLVRVVEGLTNSVERLGKRMDELASRAAKSAARGGANGTSARKSPAKSPAKSASHAHTAKGGGASSGAAARSPRKRSGGSAGSGGAGKSSKQAPRRNGR